MDGEPAATWRALGLEQACWGEAARPRKSSDLQVALRSHLDDSRTVSEDIATRSTCQLLHRHFHPYPTCELPPTTSSPPSPWQSVCHTPPCLPPIHLPALRLPPSGSSRPLTSPWLPSTTQRPDSGSPVGRGWGGGCPQGLAGLLPVPCEPLCRPTRRPRCWVEEWCVTALKEKLTNKILKLPTEPVES